MNKITKKERVLQALHNNVRGDEDTIDALIAYAYYMGQEAEAKSFGDYIRKQLIEQKKRADECRYYNMARKAVGHIDDYNPNYPGDGGYTEEFGGDLTEL